MILSVIIPVYNVEKYIEKCILSVINNNLSAEYYEIIVVDDESPDNSVTIINKLIKVYSQIKLISQKNKGLGGARNTGLQYAKGDYILFLDSDDYYIENSLNTLISSINGINFDILEFGANFVNSYGVILNSISFKNKTKIERNKRFVENKGINSACNKLYSRSFINKYKLKFKEKVYSEDFEFNTRAYFLANSIYTSNLIIASFLINPNSITRTKTVSHYNKYMSSYLSNLEGLIVFFNNYKLSKLEKEYYNYYLTLLNNNIFYYAFKNGKNIKDLKELKTTLRKNKMLFLNSNLYNLKKNIFKKIIRLI